jgi:hypothetical protein
MVVTPCSLEVIENNIKNRRAGQTPEAIETGREKG